MSTAVYDTTQQHLFAETYEPLARSGRAVRNSARFLLCTIISYVGLSYFSTPDGTVERTHRPQTATTLLAKKTTTQQALDKGAKSMSGNLKKHIPPDEILKVINAMAIQKFTDENGVLTYRFIKNPALADIGNGQLVPLGGPGTRTQLEAIDGDYAICGDLLDPPHLEHSPLGFDNVHDGPADSRIGKLRTSPYLPDDCKTTFRVTDILLSA